MKDRERECGVEDDDDSGAGGSECVWISIKI